MERVEVSGARNEETWSGEFDNQMLYWRQHVQRETSRNLPRELVYMDGKRWTRMNSKETNIN